MTSLQSTMEDKEYFFDGVNEEKLFNTQEAAFILSISDPSLYNYKKQKKIKGTKILHKTFYTLESIEVFLRANSENLSDRQIKKILSEKLELLNNRE